MGVLQNPRDIFGLEAVETAGRAASLWPVLVDLLEGLVKDDRDLPGQIHRVRKF